MFLGGDAIHGFVIACSCSHASFPPGTLWAIPAGLGRDGRGRNVPYRLALRAMAGDAMGLTGWPWARWPGTLGARPAGPPPMFFAPTAGDAISTGWRQAR